MTEQTKYCPWCTKDVQLSLCTGNFKVCQPCHEKMKKGKKKQVNEEPELKIVPATLFIKKRL